MATNTCVSIITYQNDTDMFTEPFLTERDALSVQMFNQGKTASNPNWIDVSNSNGERVGIQIGERAWVDHAAAQEFLDWVVSNAPAYDVNVVSTDIQDL